MFKIVKKVLSRLVTITIIILNLRGDESKETNN